MSDGIYLEDLSVGQVFLAGPIVFSLEDILRFAREYDPQMFHVDPEGAKSSYFGGVIASGWHTAAISMRLLTESVPFVGGVIGLGGEIAWPRPVRPGDELRVEARVAKISPPRSGSDRGVVSLPTTTTNQDGEPVQRLDAKLFIAARGAKA